jgi:hypothetical protein
LEFMRSKNPAAVQAVADVHDTPVSPMSYQVARTAICSWDHLLPFQRSTTGAIDPQPPLSQGLSLHPTAKQAFLDEQETLTLVRPKPNFRWIDHLRPFQRSTIFGPSAIQNVFDVHDTAARGWSMPALATVGVASTVQREPFQRSSSRTELPPLSTCDPTAKQNVLDGQDTPES